MSGPQESGAFNWASVAPSEELWLSALDAFNGGSSFEQIGQLLVTNGLDPDNVGATCGKIAIDRVGRFLLAGKSRAEIIATLKDRGMDDADATRVFKLGAANINSKRSAAGASGWQLGFILVGGVCFVSGILAFNFADGVVPVGVSTGLMALGVLLSGLGGVMISVGIFPR